MAVSRETSVSWLVKVPSKGTACLLQQSWVYVCCPFISSVGDPCSPGDPAMIKAAECVQDRNCHF